MMKQREFSPVFFSRKWKKNDGQAVVLAEGRRGPVTEQKKKWRWRKKKERKKIYIQLIRAYRHITKQGHCPGHTPGRLPNKVNGSFIKWPPLDRAPISSGCWSGEISLGFDRFDLLFPFGESWRGLLQQPTKPSSSFKSDRLLFVVRAVKFPFIGNLQALIA